MKSQLNRERLKVREPTGSSILKVSYRSSFQMRVFVLGLCDTHIMKCTIFKHEMYLSIIFTRWFCIQTITLPFIKEFWVTVSHWYHFLSNMVEIWVQDCNMPIIINRSHKVFDKAPVTLWSEPQKHWLCALPLPTAPWAWFCLITC